MLEKRAVLPPAASAPRIAALLLLLGACGRDPDKGDLVPPTPGTDRLALVYRGPGSCAGCAEDLAALLEHAGLRTRYVGPADLLADATFAGAALYAQPGGDNTMQVYYAVGAANWPAVADRLRAFVRGGGRYLGVCLGGFLAGPWMDDDGTIAALALLRGDASYFTKTPVDSRLDQVVPITWLSPRQSRTVYFQEGPYFIDDGGVPYATWSDGSVAALIADYGKGKVGVSGFHFEATDDWYAAHDLIDPDGPDADLGIQLIDDLMR